MIPALALAVTLGAASPPALEAPSLVERFREACVATQMRREAFQGVFAGRNLEPLIPVVRPGDNPSSSDWMIGYDDDGIQTVMEGHVTDRSHATDCAVLILRPQGDWRADVAHLAQNLNMQPTTPSTLPNIRESRSWKTRDDSAITLYYEVYSEAVVVRFEQSPQANP